MSEKAAILAWIFLAGLTVAGIWKLARWPETVREHDEFTALRDARRAKLMAARQGFWKRAELRLAGMRRSLEAKAK